MGAGKVRAQAYDQRMAAELSLREVVHGLRYKPGWEFELLQGRTFGSAAGTAGWSDLGRSTAGAWAAAWPDEPLLLQVIVSTWDSREPDRMIRVAHQFPVPAGGAYTMPWDKWVLDCIAAVERHEMCEFFSVNGKRPFYPAHGPDVDPYEIRRAGAAVT